MPTAVWLILIGLQAAAIVYLIIHIRRTAGAWNSRLELIMDDPNTAAEMPHPAIREIASERLRTAKALSRFRDGLGESERAGTKIGRAHV